MNAILDMTLRDAMRSLACGTCVAVTFWLPFLWWLARAW